MNDGELRINCRHINRGSVVGINISEALYEVDFAGKTGVRNFARSCRRAAAYPFLDKG